jgi:Aromatic-ring-opening dioxygenase LigAB, LigA subunit
MSIYAVNKLCRDALHDPAWREALKRDPKSAIAPLPLSDDERSALLDGDVAWLYEQGAHPFLLAYLTRWELFGLTVSLYSERIRGGRASPASVAVQRSASFLRRVRNADF